MSVVSYLFVGLDDTPCRKATETTMADAYKLDCESEAGDCRFIVQSESELEAIELAKNHMLEGHGQDYSDDELREEHLQVV